MLVLPRLVSIIDPHNGASIRVAEKIGLRYEKEVLFRQNLRHLYVIRNQDLAVPGDPADRPRH